MRQRGGPALGREPPTAPFVLFPKTPVFSFLHGPDFLLKRPGAHAQAPCPMTMICSGTVAADNAGAVLLRQLVGRALNVHIRRLGLAGVDNIQIVVLLHLLRVPPRTL